MDNLILCVGTGRDGTNSLALLIQNIFTENHHNGTAIHELHHKEIYNAFHTSIDQESFTKAIERFISTWRLGDAIIGNGYAPAIDIIADVFKGHIKLVHLIREKNVWMESFKKNIETYPHSHGNYAACEDPQIFRMAAFHFGECTKQEWEVWNLNQKLSWYYDKTHTLVTAIGKSVPCLEIRTEELSKPETGRKLAAFIDKSWTYAGLPVRANVSMLDYAQFSAEDQKVLGRVYSTFDYLQAAHNPIYGERFFANLVKEGFLSRDSYEHSTVSAEQIREYVSVLRKRAEEFEQMIKA